MQDLILIIEDNKTIAMYEKNTLEEMGLDVLVAHNMDELQPLLDEYKSKITLAVVDINLPNCEDCVLDKLLKLNIPCIAMTGAFHTDLRNKVIDKKLIDYIVLEDDQNLDILKSTISRILNNKNTKILVVDDSISARFALKDVLLHQNYTVLEAHDALYALKLIKDNDIKMALVDYEMPNMNGAELTRTIRKSYSRNEMAILAISAYTNSVITIEFLKAGANDFVTKPFVKEEVVARIGVNIDMIDQHKMLKNEILIREDIEKDLINAKKEAEHLNMIKSNFLANMSHEIRTPLNAIVGFIDILYKDESSKDKKDKLEIIKNSSYSLLSIINDILDLSKVESGKLELEHIIFDTEYPFKHTTELFYAKAREKKIEIMFNIDPDLPDKAYGDPGRISQIYSNILSNAIKFSDTGSSIDININYSTNEKKLTCSVKDYGVGIDSSKIEKVFSAFEQEDNSTTRKFGGTGLGLSISKSLIDLMHGDLSVDSILGEGSTFYFELSLFEDIENQIDSEIRQENEPIYTEDLLSGKVLLVEDNKPTQMLMSIFLNDYGLDVDIANDGLEAVEMCRNEHDYKLILMDENMPNMNGIEATRIIKELEQKRGVITPIIAVTANALLSDRERFLNAGMDDYMSKPVDSKILENILRKYIQS
ncbi:response regulator [Sulfurimonas sp.]|nr:response regulator [Sulfurimonas sp.]